MFKCKPHAIEQIHWNSDFIARPVCLSTAWNVIETEKRASLESVSLLLLEEFSEEQVTRSASRIQKAATEVNAELDLQDKVEGLIVGFGEETKLRPVMAHLAPHFPKLMMRKVYQKVAILRPDLER